MGTLGVGVWRRSTERIFLAVTVQLVSALQLVTKRLGTGNFQRAANLAQITKAAPFSGETKRVHRKQEKVTGAIVPTINCQTSSTEVREFTKKRVLWRTA